MPEPTIEELNRLLETSLPTRDRTYNWMPSDDPRLFLTIDVPVMTEHGLESERSVVNTQYKGIDGKTIGLAVKDTQRSTLVPDPRDPSGLAPWTGFWVMAQLFEFSEFLWERGTGSLDTFPLGGRQWFPVQISGMDFVRKDGSKVPIPMHLDHQPNLAETWDAIHVLRSTVEAPKDVEEARERREAAEAKQEKSQKAEMAASYKEAAWATLSPPGTRGGEGAVGLIDPKSPGYKTADGKLGGGE